MRRIFVALTAFLALTGTFLVLPVYAAPEPEAEAVTTSTDAVAMGSVDDPAPAAEVQEGTTDPVSGVADSAPTLTVTRTEVEEFSLVGVTWAYDAAVTDTVVQVRVQDATGAWGGWTEVLAETADQSATEDRTGAQLRGGTSPLWTGPSTGVEAELVTRAGAQPTDVQLDLVDPGESAADTSLTSPDITDTAHAATTMPPVYSRGQWGADESIRTWDPQKAATIKAATLHHTADTNNYSADQVPAMMRSIYRYHTVSLGWGDIGYNVIVDKFGRLWEGRYGGLASTVIGAHAGGFNTSTFGVSMLGNYDVVPVPQVTVDSVAAIIAWKFSLYGVDPRGTTTLTSGGGGTAKYAKGEQVTLPTVFAHRNVGNTACPGQHGYARMGEIRDRVTALMGGPDGPPSPEIDARYASDAGLRSLLGAKIGGTRSAGGAVWQAYANGRLYWSPGSGVRLMKGLILERYLEAGGPAALGAPITDEWVTPDGQGRYNHLAGGASVYWLGSTGAHVVSGEIKVRWAALGWELGPTGYPVTDPSCGLTGGGCVQVFQNGQLVWSPATGARLLQEPALTRWADLGRQNGVLGYPVTDAGCALVNGGCGQVFQGGSVYWSPTTAAHVVRGAIRDLWASTGWETGALGYPTSDETCGLRDGGCWATFQYGSVYWTGGLGAHLVWAPMRDKWAATGYENGPLGYPTANPACGGPGGGCVQAFQRGALYWSPATGAWQPKGEVQALWIAVGAEWGALGYPTGDVVCGLRGTGCFESFERGSIYWTPSLGAHLVWPPLRDKWGAMGYENGPLGYPTANPACGGPGGGCLQSYEGGVLYWSPNTGAWRPSGAIQSMWVSVGAEWGVLGYPTSDVNCGLRSGGCYESFQHGLAYSSPTTGTHFVSGQIREAFAGAGHENGTWGYPTGNPMRRADGDVTQRFQQGIAVWDVDTRTVSFG